MNNAAQITTAASTDTIYDVVVVGGGPAGATAANDLARAGKRVLLLDRAGRIKPCGGAIPPRLIKDFGIPDELLVAHARAARMISPKDIKVDIPIEGGFVGMVNREHFDEWLRERAASAGAERRVGSFEKLSRDAHGATLVHFMAREKHNHGEGTPAVVRARAVIGADGARSGVAHQAGLGDTEYVFAYHEIVRAPDMRPLAARTPPPPGGGEAPGKAGSPPAAANAADYDPSRCDVYYRGTLSPDFYGWVFPHGDTFSVGTGSADKGFSLRNATGRLRDAAGLTGCETLRREGAPIPMKPLKRWDDGKSVVLAGDAAGVVAPASGEGLYYAMAGGRMAGEAVLEFLKTGNSRALAGARKQFMKEHGTVFFVLGIMQRFWYTNDKRRERFVAICKDKDVQQMTFESYMHKKLTRKKPMQQVRIFFKDMAHLLGFARV